MKLINIKEMEERHMKKILSLICLVAILLCSFAAFAEEKDPLMDYDNEYMKALAGKRIAVANIYLGDEWCKLLADTFVKYGEIYGFEVNSQDGNLDHDTQMRQIENFIIQQYDMILVDPANGEGIGDVLEPAREKGIPVIAYDAAAVWDGLVSQVSGDNFGNGVKLGEAMRDYINENLDGKAKVVMLNMYQPHTMARADGIHSVLDEMPGVEFLTEQDSQGNREVAANIISNIKEDYDIIVSVVPNGWLGAISALETMGKNPEEVRVFGPVSSEEAYEILRDGAAGEPCFLEAGYSSDARLMATMTIEAAGKYFAGEEVEELQYVIPVMVDKTNINDYYPAAE